MAIISKEPECLQDMSYEQISRECDRLKELINDTASRIVAFGCPLNEIQEKTLELERKHYQALTKNYDYACLIRSEKQPEVL